METELDPAHFSALEAPPAIAFAIEYNEPGNLAPSAVAGRPRQSIVVRIEPPDVLFILGPTEPETATRSFAEALARRTALSALEKDIPADFELALSARQIDHIPPEIENRLPDFYMNGNRVWMVGSV